MKKISSNKGFTLVELIIVIAILAIIMLIAIPNFSGIQQRMQVRADKSTAAQIGKAVRIWYTEYNSDPAFKAQVDDGTGLPTGAGSAMVPLFNITNIEGYVDKTLLPTSLRNQDGTSDPNQMYVVGLVGAGTSEKVVVSIVSETVTKDTTTGKITACTVADTDTGTAGIQGSKHVTLPAVTAEGATALDSKTSPKYDGDYIATPADFTEALAYMEP